MSTDRKIKLDRLLTTALLGAVFLLAGWIYALNAGCAS